MRFFIFSLLFFFAALLFAQPCDGSRYRDEIFSDFTVEEVVYTTARSYRNKIDIYQPVGDTASKRPLVIFAHGGGFFDGNKDADTTLAYLCKKMAKRGFVAVSIQYRITQQLTLIDSIKMMGVVFKAVQDGRAVVRFFREDAATLNIYKIDTGNIFFGGTSAGAVLAMHMMPLKPHKVFPPYIQQIIDNAGGFNGNLGHEGYNSEAKAYISMAGGVNKLEFLDAGDEPVCLVHGELDKVIPFYFDQVYREPPYDLFQLATIHGSGNLHPYLNGLGVPNVLLSYPNEGHTPWDYVLPIRQEVDTFIMEFLLDQICNIPTPVPVNRTNHMSVYPVPAREMIYFDLNGLKLESLEVFDVMGNKIKVITAPKGKFEISVKDWSAGIYLVNGYSETGEMFSKKMIVE